MSKKEKKSAERNKQLRRYGAVSGLGIQAAVTIFVFGWGGRKLDDYFGTKKNWIAALFVVVGVFFAIFILLKQLKRLNDKE